MIPSKRLTIGMQYWITCKTFKVFARYNGHEKNVLKFLDAFIYFTDSPQKNFCIEQHLLIDNKSILNIKFDDSEEDADFSDYYSKEEL